MSMGNKKEEKGRLENLTSKIQQIEPLVVRINSLSIGEIIGYIDKEEKTHVPIEDWKLKDLDNKERVRLLLDKFKKCVDGFDYSGVIKTWEAMIKMVEDRKLENEEKMGQIFRKTEDEKKYIFKEAVNKNLPKIPFLKADDGSMAVSTYKSGIGGFLSAEMKLMVMNLGMGEKKYKGILDDRITLSQKWIRISNAFGRGDERVREEIRWENSGDLTMNYDPPAALNFINKIKAVIGKNPEPIAPVGILTLYHGQGQSTDADIPEVVYVLVSNPLAWVRTFNELKGRMAEVGNRDEGTLKEQVYMRHFWKYGLQDIFYSRQFRNVLPHQAELTQERLLDEKRQLTEEIQRRKPNWFGRK